jgi:hypothetical protein
MSETGRVISVDESVRGSSLAEDVLVNDVQIVVESVDDFEEDGGVLTVNGVRYAYTTPDDATLTIPVATQTLAAVEGDPVLIYPQPVARYAQVVLEDAPDVPIAALVPHALVGRIASGLEAYGDFDAVEVVETSAGSWEVRDLLGRRYARSGMNETDWRNSKGLTILLGDPESDVAEYWFTGAEMVAEFVGPASVPLPNPGSTIRRVGRGGQGSNPVSITVDFPAKVTLAGVASVENGTATDCNVRLYLLAVDTADDSNMAGRQATQFVNGDDLTNNRHRQISNQRQLTMNGTPDDPLTYTFWWGFQQDSATASRAMTLRNLKMTLRVTYAPDLPTTESPERAPQWTTFADTTEAYTNVEGNDAG